MVLTQTDVAELSMWFKSRKSSFWKTFSEGLAERRLIREEPKIMKEMDAIKNDILNKHKLVDAKKKIEKMLGNNGDIEKFYKDMEEVIKYNFKLIAAVTYALDEMMKIAEAGASKHLMPEAMAKDTVQKVREQSKTLKIDMHAVRLMAQKIDSLEKAA